MKNYLIGLVITLGISGCVSIPSIDFSQQKLKGLIQLKIGLVLIPLQSRICQMAKEIFKLKGEVKFMYSGTKMNGRY